MTFANKYLIRALELARLAYQHREVPVGAVIVKSGQIIGEGYNTTIMESSPLAHAELNAIRAACSTVGNCYLEECELYVTLEPCPMCAGAISNARIGKLYYGAHDIKSGGVEHGPRIFHNSSCHHRPQVYSGIMEEQCSELMRIFFKELRKQ